MALSGVLGAVMTAAYILWRGGGMGALDPRLGAGVKGLSDCEQRCIRDHPGGDKASIEARLNCMLGCKPVA